MMMMMIIIIIINVIIITNDDNTDITRKWRTYEFNVGGRATLI